MPLVSHPAARVAPGYARYGTRPLGARKVFAWAAVCALIFVVYGSLVPFGFVAESWAQASEALWEQAFRGTVRRSLTDWATNFALFIPLSFAWMGALYERRQPARNALAALGVMAGCALVSIAVELGQAFLPTRISAWSDFAWNMAGGGAGLAVWLVSGPALSARLDRLAGARALPAHRRLAQLGLAAALPYLVVLAAANGWMSHAWLDTGTAAARAVELSWLPFVYHQDANIITAGISAFKYALLYAPAGALWLLLQLRRPQARPYQGLGIAAWAAVALAALFEASKLLLDGLRPDTGNIVLAALGAAAGWLALYGVLQAAAGRARAPEPESATAAPGIGPVPLETSGMPEESTALPGSAERGGSRRRHRKSGRARRRRRSRPRSHHAYGAGRFDGLRRASLALGALVAASVAVWGVIVFPVGAAILAGALALYGLVLWRMPAAWLVVLPALLPVLDLTPWSGWYYLTELDLFVAVTLAIGLARAAGTPTQVRMPRRIKWPLALFAVSCAVSLAIGILPLQPLDHAAFSGSFSRYAALLPAKALLSALLLIPLAARAIDRGTDVRRLFTAGMALGLLGVCAVAVWERIAYPGLFDFNTQYRIAASFSTMNTGGGHVEAYLVLVTPFVVAAIHFSRSAALRIALALLFVLASYALMVTFSRAGYAAFALAMVLLIAMTMASAVKRPWARTAFFAPVILAALAVLVAAPVLEGRFVRSRLAATETDWGTRVAHWQDVVGMMDQDLLTTAFGMGLGRFPETYFYRGTGARPSAPFHYRTEAGNTFLRFGVGAPLYVEQIAAIAPYRSYVVSFDARSDGEKPVVNVLLCERSYFYSAGCQSAVVKLRNEPGQWQHHTAEIASGKLGATPWYAHRPVKLSLENASQAAAVDIDNVRMTGNDRRNLVANGDFSHGGARWYFSSAVNHLPWHIKNLPLEIYFGQGLFGLVAFGALALVSAIWLAKWALRGDFYSCIVFAALAGFAAVGMFDSLFDAPRLLLVSLLMLSIWALSIRQAMGLVARTPAAAGRMHVAPAPVRGPAVSETPAAGAEAAEAASLPAVGAAIAPSKEAFAPGSARSEPPAAAFVPTPAMTATGTAMGARAASAPRRTPWYAHVPWLHLAAGVVLCTVAGWIVTRAPMVPYNLRELPNPSHPYLALVILSVFLYWAFGVPAFIAHRMRSTLPAGWLLPLLVLAHAWVAWFLLHIAVLPESIHDVVGKPVLGWPWEWERMGRFVALFSVLSLLAIGAALSVGACKGVRFAHAVFCWALTAAAFLPLCWWIVVPMAATDNVVELIADSGALWACALLAAWLFVIAFAGSTLAATATRVGRVSWLRALVVLLLSVPVAWLLLGQGTESVIVKGRQTYSALQFLLSADRRSLAAGADLVWRYGVAHLALVGMIAWVQYPFWLYLRRRREP